jgi:hypothetical protein
MGLIVDLRGLALHEQESLPSILEIGNHLQAPDVSELQCLDNSEYQQINHCLPAPEIKTVGPEPSCPGDKA